MLPLMIICLFFPFYKSDQKREVYSNMPKRNSLYWNVAEALFEFCLVLFMREQFDVNRLVSLIDLIPGRF